MKIQKVFIYILVLIVLIFTLFPFFWMIITSLKSPNEIFSKPPIIIPDKLHVDAYKSMLNPNADANLNFMKWFYNSTKVSVLTTIFSLIISALGGYGLSRFRSKVNGGIGYIILVTQMLPGSLLIIPLYIIMKDMNLLNTHLGLVLANTTFALPFCTWMMKGYFDTVSPSLDEAAMVDGANRWTIFSRVILPLTLPGLVVTGIFAYITSWSEFLFAYTFLNDYDKWTLSVGIASFQGQYVVNWDYLMAGSVFTTLPIVIVFWIFQKYLISGMTAGSVK